MNADRAVALAIVVVISASVVGIYTENKKSKIALAQVGISTNSTRGRPLAN